MTMTAVIALNALMDVALLGALAHVMQIPFRLDPKRPERRETEPRLELAA